MLPAEMKGDGVSVGRFEVAKLTEKVLDLGMDTPNVFLQMAETDMRFPAHEASDAITLSREFHI